MSFINAKEHLKNLNLEKNIILFNDSSATVSLAAKALNCKEEEIAKTLGFLVEDKPILIVCAGNRKIDNTKYKSYFHTKAKMIPFDEVQSTIGHEVGGVCPFGIKENVTIYLDESLKDYPIIYPACGSHNSAVKLTLKELEQASSYKEYIDVCKIIEN